MLEEMTSIESQTSDLNNSLPAESITPGNSYHISVCGSIIQPLASNSLSDIFEYIRHGKFGAFRRSIDIYHPEIILMKNNDGQTVLHVLSINAHQYPWVRLLLMRGCDPSCQDNDGYTAAHYVVERDDVEMLKALTTRIHPSIKLFSEEQITSIHQRCLKPLSVRNNQGLTVFMLACQHESLKCLNYLLELQINDINLKDNFGDTCLHYAVARRNVTLVNILIDRCHANVNDGDQSRPSVLDVLQFNREQQKPFDRVLDDSIEQILLTHNAINRCQIRRITAKRKRPLDNDENVIANLACLSVDSMSTSQVRTAQNCARIALSYQHKSDLGNAYEFYKRAMNAVPNNVLDWADYAFQIAVIDMVRGDNQLALGILQPAIALRKQLENTSEKIDSLQRMIDTAQSRIHDRSKTEQ